ncbi:MAG TPA: hypothetical protein VGC77_10125 [Rhodopseudomonas sp.]|uniref:hypothetical protein n=1 Tax=Rhodopseudomonas sp. TaxID=1078 RepID=UPI002EDA7E7C
MTKLPENATQPSNTSWRFASLIVALVILKIVLVAHHEIAATSRAHDDYWQVLSANA